jgi:threonine synthase
MCPEGAATISAARKLLSEGELSPNDTVLLLNTGSTTKYFELIA